MKGRSLTASLAILFITAAPLAAQSAAPAPAQPAEAKHAELYAAVRAKYPDGVITEADAVGVSVRHSRGVTRIEWSELPTALRARYGYSEARAAAQARAEDKAYDAGAAAARAAKARKDAEDAASVERAKGEAREAAAAAKLATKVRRLNGTVLQRFDNTLVCAVEISGQSALSATGKPLLVAIVDHPQHADLADGAEFAIVAVPDGVATFRDPIKGPTTIPRWRATGLAQ